MTITADLLLLVLFALVVKFLYFVTQRRKDLKVFQRLGIPGPEPNFFSGNLYQLNRADALPHEVIEEWITKYGNVFGYFRGERPYLVINDTEMLRKIFLQSGSNFRNRPGPFIDVEPIIHSLLFQKDENWKRSRRVLQPVFGQNQVKADIICQIITGCAERMVESFSRYGQVRPDGSLLVPFYPRMQATSLDVILRTALNLETEVHDENNAVLIAVREYFSDAMNFPVRAATVLPILRPIMKFINDHLTAGKMTDLAVSHIRKQIVMAAEQTWKKDDSENQMPATTFLNALLRCLASGLLSEDEVIGNAHLVLLGGYETTANSVTFLMHYLANNQEHQDRLRQSFKSDDDDFFQMVWMEILRIVPPAPTLVERIASNATEIDGIRIEKGTVIEAPAWTIHHDPNIWPEPHKFDPYRFTEENRKGLDPMTFLTFGTGGRLCLGMNLATEEAKIIVHQILTKFIVTPSNSLPLKLKFQTNFLNPADSVELIFTPIGV